MIQRFVGPRLDCGMESSLLLLIRIEMDVGCWIPEKVMENGVVG